MGHIYKYINLITEDTYKSFGVCFLKFITITGVREIDHYSSLPPLELLNVTFESIILIFGNTRHIFTKYE